jgi:hypothetical protein
VRVLIHPRGLTADAEFRDNVTHALETGLGTVLTRLRRVDAYLTDVNGPRGGPDKRCRVVAHLATGPVVVERTGRDPVAATAEAAARCRRVVLARLKRGRDRRRRAAA